jgi:hypothetical protein
LFLFTTLQGFIIIIPTTNTTATGVVIVVVWRTWSPPPTRVGATVKEEGARGMNGRLLARAGPAMRAHSFVIL